MLLVCVVTDSFLDSSEKYSAIHMYILYYTYYILYTLLTKTHTVSDLSISSNLLPEISLCSLRITLSIYYIYTFQVHIIFRLYIYIYIFHLPPHFPLQFFLVYLLYNYFLFFKIFHTALLHLKPLPNAICHTVCPL